MIARNVKQIHEHRFSASNGAPDVDAFWNGRVVEGGGNLALLLDPEHLEETVHGVARRRKSFVGAELSMKLVELLYECYLLSVDM